MSKIVLVHQPDGKYFLKSGGVSLQGVTSVDRSVENGLPVVTVKAALAAKEYVNSVNSAMVLVVDEDGNESLKHGDVYVDGLLNISETDGVVEMKLAVSSEDYEPLINAPKKEEKKAAPKLAEKPVTKKSE